MTQVLFRRGCNSLSRFSAAQGNTVNDRNSLTPKTAQPTNVTAISSQRATPARISTSENIGETVICICD